jgi:hypothetical protein
VLAIVVDAPRVVDAAVGKLHLAEQTALGVELEQPAAPAALGAVDGEVVQSVRLGPVAHRGLEHLDGRHEERAADLYHALGVERGPSLHVERIYLFPDRVLPHQSKERGGGVVARVPATWPILFGM